MDRDKSEEQGITKDWVVMDANKELYKAERDDLWNRQKSACESIDNLIGYPSLGAVMAPFVLTLDLSCGFMATAWLCFFVAFLFLFLSHLATIRTAYDFEPKMRAYYLDGGDKPVSRWASAVTVLNCCARVSFLAALILISIKVFS